MKIINKNLLLALGFLGFSYLSSASAPNDDFFHKLETELRAMKAAYETLQEITAPLKSGSRSAALQGLDKNVEKLAAWREDFIARNEESDFAFYETEELIAALQGCRKAMEALQDPLQTSTSFFARDFFTGNPHARQDKHAERNQKLRDHLALLDKYAQKVVDLDAQAVQNKETYPARASRALNHFKDILTRPISYDNPIPRQLIEDLESYDNDYLNSSKELRKAIHNTVDRFYHEYKFVPNYYASYEDLHDGVTTPVNGYVSKTVAEMEIE